MQDITSYKTLEHVEHVKLRPEIYLGNMILSTNSYFAYDIETNSIQQKNIDMIDGLLKICNEIIDNAVDNIFRDPPTQNIWVEFDDKNQSVCISNDGKHIPCIKNEQGVIIPSMIFGNLLSGSNFDDTNRQSIGTFGIGSTICNIFSDLFEVECYDPIEGLKFKQTWENQMTKTKGPIIKKIKKVPKKLTSVFFKPCMQTIFKEAKWENLKTILITRLHQIQSTINKKINIYIDNKRLPSGSFEKYIKLFGKKYSHQKVNESFEMAVSTSTNDTFMHSAFVNNQYTSDPSSSHTRYVTNVVKKAVQESIKSKIKDSNVSLNTIESKLHIFVNMTLKNPKFSSQTKVKLTNKISSKEYPLDQKRIVALLKKQGIIDEIIEEMKKNSIENMSKKLSSKKSRNVNVEGLIDANFAGTSKSKDCTLFLTEGKSALGSVKVGLSVVGREMFGAIALKGKIINVSKSSVAQITRNKEINDIIKILGLDMKKTYKTKEEIDSLRYGKVALFTDADSDGNHIFCLALNLINKFWPCLIDQGYVQRFITATIVATRGKEIKHFFNIEDFNKWHDSASGKWDISYKKGLGSSNRDEMIEYFRAIDKYLKNIVKDEQSDDMMKLAFDPKLVQKRKDWISRPDYCMPSIDYSKENLQISTTIDRELNSYSKYSVRRAIPSLLDGLKESMRKILFTVLNRTDKKVKVAQLASEVALKSMYLHGETSLNGAITGLAQSFPGANNLPLLTENGQFGTRCSNGDDAASPRYIFTSMRPYLNKLFLPEDANVLRYRIEEGEQIEPYFYVPTLPLAIVNGTLGIATGFVSNIPQYNPLEIIKYLRNPTQRIPLMPFYHGFKGSFMQKNGDIICNGVFERINGTTIMIKDIPIGPSSKSLDSYESSVIKKLEQTGVIRKFTSNPPDENSCDWKIYLNSSMSDEEIVKKFQLQTKINTKNFNLILPDGSVKNYKSVHDIINDWLRVKMEYIEKRKDYMLQDYRTQSTYLRHKIMFIELIIDNKLVISKRKKQDIVNDLLQTEINHQYHDQFLSMSISSLTKEKVEELKSKYDQIQAKINNLKNTTAEKLFHHDLDVLEVDINKYFEEKSNCSNLKKRKRQQINKNNKKSKK